LWFGTAGGLCKVTLTDPAALHPSQFPVLVEDVTVDGSVRAEPSRIRITAGTRSVELRYTALTLSNSEAVEFRYRLEGFDDDWVQAGTRRLAFYNNLKPGTYKFRVDARIGGEDWRQSPALVLEQLPFFYQTWWFIALVSAAVLSLIIFIYRLRLRQAVNRIQAGFQQRVDERTRIARELHDTLLQSFQALIFQFQAARNMVPRKPEDAMHALDEAITATAQAIAESRDAISDLRPDPAAQRDLPELLSAAGPELARTDSVNGNPPTFRMFVEGKPRTIPGPIQDEVYRIACEAIRNAVLHARASRIEGEVHYDKDRLRLRIRDDGKGIDPKILANGGRSGHWGIPGTLERAKRIGSRVEFWTEEGAGTEIELVIPAAIAYEKVRDGRRFRLFRGI
jgi:signal transduction histidine kinase